MKTAAKPSTTIPGAPVPAHLRVFVDVLGADQAVAFLLKFGGGVSYFSESPQERSPIASFAGVDNARALARALGSGSVRIPTGKPFIARYYRDMGWKVTAIARQLHVTDVTVRSMLRTADSRQLALFDLPAAD